MLSRAGRDLIRKLLTADRTKRIGNLKGGAEDIKKHKWYRGLNWAALYNKQARRWRDLPVTLFEGTSSSRMGSELFGMKGVTPRAALAAR